MNILDVPNNQILYASCLVTLEDIAKTEACKNKFIHCAFSYKDYEQLRNPVERELKKMGVAALWFQKVGLIKLK